jgi:hypothetical protein
MVSSVDGIAGAVAVGSSGVPPQRRDLSGAAMIDLRLLSTIGRIGRRLLASLNRCADHRAAAELERRLSALSDAELAKRGLTRATLAQTANRTQMLSIRAWHLRRKGKIRDIFPGPTHTPLALSERRKEQTTRFRILSMPVEPGRRSRYRSE